MPFFKNVIRHELKNCHKQKFKLSLYKFKGPPMPLPYHLYFGFLLHTVVGKKRLFGGSSLQCTFRHEGFMAVHKTPSNAFLNLIDSSILWCGNEVTAEDFTLGVPIHDIEQPSIKYGWYDVRFEAFNDQYLRRWILNIPHSTFLFSFCNYINKRD